MITIGKEGTLMARRRAGAILRTDESIRKLFGVLAPRYTERTGGYTRVLRCVENRKGDNAPVAWIEYADRQAPCEAPAICQAPVLGEGKGRRASH
jgi:large subunit ribosomal protein L17